MKILMVCAEFAPWAKTGGLGDAVAGLSAALRARGHDVRALLPAYSHLARPVAWHGALPIGELAQAAGTETRHDSRPRIFVLDLAELTDGAIYTGDARDAARFLRLAAAGARFDAGDGWRPDVVHCHDWHAALTPFLLRDVKSSPPNVLTLHNVGYQGVFSAAAVRARVPRHVERAVAALAAEDPVNFLRAGLRAANRITAVSPTYANEILQPEFGLGLEDVLSERRSDLVGILNGVDYGVWSPEKDPFLADRYTREDVRPKLRIKAKLLGRLRLDADTRAPLLGVVSRLAAQKGIDLLTAALPALLAETRARFAVLASGDPALAAELRRFATANPGRIAFVDGYDESLAHTIFAGCDAVLVPSRYEPCGLTQLYALRYGTIPIVRATGGLADTVQQYDPATGAGNGSVFRDADAGGLLWGIRTALGWFADPTAWARLMANAMAADFSWHKQAPHYEAVYRALV